MPTQKEKGLQHLRGLLHCDTGVFSGRGQGEDRSKGRAEIQGSPHPLASVPSGPPRGRSSEAGGPPCPGEPVHTWPGALAVWVPVFLLIEFYPDEERT